MVTIRSASAADGELLRRMLVLTADWRPDAVARSVAVVLADPALSHYVLGWPRPDDFGVVADGDDGEPLGAAWSRYFSADDPGYGFVAPDVPEVAIAVVAEARFSGVGRRLMTALIEAARARGVARLSLSVELDNPARHLYESLGFWTIDEVDGAATMVLSSTAVSR